MSVQPRVALETTLLVHGVPRPDAPGLDRMLREIVRSRGAVPALVGLIKGEPVTDLDPDGLVRLLDMPHVEKLNTANLGIAMHRRTDGATTVSATMEIAARAGIRFFATGGIGGVHHGVHERLDISSDLAACARFPVAVITSGTKSILDVPSTREALESLGVPVVGYRTDAYPAFYMRQTTPPIGLDARFDDDDELAAFATGQMARTGRAVVICNPIPAEHEIEPGEWATWMELANAKVKERGAEQGRAVTPMALEALHHISEARTLTANIELVKSNADLAARLAAAAG